MSKFSVASLDLPVTSVLSTAHGADRDDEGDGCEQRQCASDFKLTPSGGDFGFVDMPLDSRPDKAE